MTNGPEKGVVGVTWAIFDFYVRNHISGTAGVRRQIFYAGGIYQVLAFRWQTAPNWCGQGHITDF